jgi:hypothetical protein
MKDWFFVVIFRESGAHPALEDAVEAPPVGLEHGCVIDEGAVDQLLREREQRWREETLLQGLVAQMEQSLFDLLHIDQLRELQRVMQFSIKAMISFWLTSHESLIF